MNIRRDQRQMNLGIAASASFLFFVAAMFSLLVQNADEARLSDIVRPSLVGFAICCCPFLLYPLRAFGDRISILFTIGIAVVFYHNALTTNLPSILQYLPIRHSIQADIEGSRANTRVRYLPMTIAFFFSLIFLVALASTSYGVAIGKYRIWPYQEFRLM